MKYPKLTRLAFSVMAFVLSGVGGCNFFRESEPREQAQKPYPQDFLRDDWETGPTAGDTLVRRDYRLREADQVEIIYHVRTQAEENYRVKIRDILSIRFPYNQELTQGSVEVQSDGKLHLDLIGSVKVYDKTVDEINAELIQRYSKYLNDPLLTVSFKDSKREIQDLRESIMTSPRGMSRLVPIAPDGHISLPMIGNILIGGRTIDQAHKTINNAYNDLGLRTLETTINLQTVAPLRIYVLGEVKRPGLVLNATGTVSGVTHLTLLQALAQAGSYDPKRSELSKVVVIRKRNSSGKNKAVFNVRQMLENQFHSRSQGRKVGKTLAFFASEFMLSLSKCGSLTSPIYSA